MLVYEKWNSAHNERKVYGTEANIPSVSDDELTYKDYDGDEVTLTATSQLVDDKAYRVENHKSAMLLKTDDGDKFVGVFIGNDTEAIIPEGWEVQEAEIVSIKVETEPTKTSYNSEDNTIDYTGLVIKGTYSDGDEKVLEFDTGYTIDPAEGSTITEDKTVTVTAVEDDSITTTFDLTYTA